jgi:hypothetical protein
MTRQAELQGVAHASGDQKEAGRITAEPDAMAAALGAARAGVISWIKRRDAAEHGCNVAKRYLLGLHSGLREGAAMTTAALTIAYIAVQAESEDDPLGDSYRRGWIDALELIIQSRASDQPDIDSKQRRDTQ